MSLSGITILLNLVLTLAQLALIQEQLRDPINYKSFYQIFLQINSKYNNRLGIEICYNPLDRTPYLILDVIDFLNRQIAYKLIRRDITDEGLILWILSRYDPTVIQAIINKAFIIFPVLKRFDKGQVIRRFIARTLEIKKSGESQKFNKLSLLGTLTPYELQVRSSTITAFELIRQINTINLQNLYTKQFLDKAKYIQATY